MSVPVTGDGVRVVVGDVTITAPAGVAPAGAKLMVRRVADPAAGVREVDAAGVLDLRLSTGAQPAKPVTVSWRTTGGKPAPAAATKPENSPIWQPLKVTASGGVASVRLSHFSWFWFGEVGKMVGGFVLDVKAFLGLGYPAPSCVGKPAIVGGRTYTASTDRDVVRACVADGGQNAQVRLYPNRGQVYRVRVQPGRFAGTPRPAARDLSSVAVLAVQRQLYGSQETVVLPGEADRYTPLDLADGVDDAYGEAVSDPALSLVPVAALGVEMLLTMAGSTLPDGFEKASDGYSLAQCFLKAMPVASGEWTLPGALSAFFGCAPSLVQALSDEGFITFGDRFTTKFNLLAGIAGSAVGLLAGQIQGLWNTATGDSRARFTINSNGPTATEAPEPNSVATTPAEVITRFVAAWRARDKAGMTAVASPQIANDALAAVVLDPQDTSSPFLGKPPEVGQRSMIAVMPQRESSPPGGTGVLVWVTVTRADGALRISSFECCADG